MMMVENVYGHDDDNDVRMMFGIKPEDANAWVSSEPVLGRISKKNCPADIKTSRSKILDLDSTNSNFVRCVEVRSWLCSGNQFRGLSLPELNIPDHIGIFCTLSNDEK